MSSASLCNTQQLSLGERLSLFESNLTTCQSWTLERSWVTSRWPGGLALVWVWVITRRWLLTLHQRGLSCQASSVVPMMWLESSAICPTQPRAQKCDWNGSSVMAACEHRLWVSVQGKVVSEERKTEEASSVLTPSCHEHRIISDKLFDKLQDLSLSLWNRISLYSSD